MIFSIKDRLNTAILRFTEGYAAIDFFDFGEQEPWLSLPFVQAKQVKGGLMISLGYDPDFPNKTMRFISGRLVIDELTQKISIIDKGDLKAVIRKTNPDELNAFERYLLLDIEEGRGTIDKHIESFISACKDWDNTHKGGN